MNVPEFSMDGIPAFWGDERQQSGRNLAVELPDGLKRVRISEKRRLLHMLHVANAVKHLDGLPAGNETWHCVMRGNYNFWDLVPAVLRLAEPAIITRLDIATLSFNNQNIAELAGLMDAGQIGEVWFLASCYFRDSSKAEYGLLVEQIGKPGGRVAAVRNHAKIQLMEMSSGDCYVIESSANLRSCRNVEQFSMCNDRELLQFHRAWIQKMTEGANDG